MNTATYREKISETSTNISSYSLSQKREQMNSDEEKVNMFLDRINSLRDKITSRSEKLNGYSSTLRELTWYDDVTEEDLILSNSVIAIGKDLHKLLIANYVKLTKALRPKGILKSELPLYKDSLDDFKEALNDFEDAIIVLPNDDEFQNITKELLSM